MTVQMTPDYDMMDNPIGSTLPKQLCTLLSSEGTLDASSTEAADSSKSSEYEISDEVLLQLGCNNPSHLQTPQATAANRTLFSLENDEDDDDDDELDADDRTANDNMDHHDIDDEHHLAHNYSDFRMESTSTTTYDTPNHSIATATSSPNSFERAYSDGNVSPIHPPHHTRRSLHIRVPPPPMGHDAESYPFSNSSPRSYTNDHTYQNNNNDNNNNNNHNTNSTARKQLRSRRSIPTGISRPKSFDRMTSSDSKHRGRKKASGSSSSSVGKNHKNYYTDHSSMPVGAHDSTNKRNQGVYCVADDSLDDECFSTESDNDDFIVEDRSERSRDSSSTRMRPHPHPPRLSSSSSSTTRRKSSMTSIPKQNSWWKNLSHRLSTTQSLIWMLCFVGLTSVTMIVTMNHHMAQVAQMEQQNHLSILFNHPVTRSRGLLLPPPKMPQPLIPNEHKRTTSAIKKPQVRGSKPASTETNGKAAPAVTIVAIPHQPTESTLAHHTVNLNTLAQLPHENALEKLVLSDHRTGPKGSSSSSNDHHHHHHASAANTLNHHHHHHHHPSQNQHGHAEDHHHTTTSDHHEHHSSSSSSNVNSEHHGEPFNGVNIAETQHAHHEHSHHHGQDDSIRLYVKANPSRIGLTAIPRVAIPDAWDDDRVQVSFDRVDPFLYGENFETTDNTILPRIVFLDGEYFVPSEGERIVRRHRSEITDSTQLYSILDSGDERIASMELRAPFVQGECVPMQEWQTTFNPSCNGMHELDLASMGDNRMEDDFKLFGMNGFWRNAWRYDSTGGYNSLKERDTVVLKTLRYV